MHPVAELPGQAEQRVEAALEDLVSRGSLRVPPYPAVAMRVRQVLANENYSTAQLVAAMRVDPVFTANLLRLANSPFYRRGGEVTSLAVAVQRIGPKELVRMALASALSGLVRSGGPLQGLRRRLWRQALSSALLSEGLSHLEGADEGEAFVAGLLHDAGKLVVVEAVEELWQQTGEPEGSEAGARQTIERFHVRFGGLMAERWQLPGLFGAVIATHHDAPATLGPLTRRVVLADAVAQLMEAQVDVAAADLEKVGVPSAFAAPLASLIPRIPPTVAAFEGTKEPVGTELARPAPVDGPYFVEVTGESARPWPLVRMGDATLEVLAPRPLPEGLLLEVTLEPGSLHFWVVVGRIERQGQGWVTELAPYGLGPDEAARWRALVTQRRGRAAA